MMRTAAEKPALAVPLRPPDLVMRLPRLGAFHQTRLSFMRALLRRLKRDDWAFERTLWRMDEKGNGVAIYQAGGTERTYSLIAFANDLDLAKRSDRVIAQEWDATFVLYDGVPDEADLERLAQNVPKQEAGRLSERELSLSRANRSVRLFDHIRACLAAGRQPEAAELDRAGYVMRTTAVYGNAKFGASDRDRIAGRPEFAAPFQAELLSVYLIRSFTFDILDHMAEADAPGAAVRLAPDLRRRLGVGNSTGLGMAPFIVNHPSLLNNWILARETALARIRSLPRARHREIRHFRAIVARQRHGADLWSTGHAGQAARIVEYRADLARLDAHIDRGGEDILAGARPWDALYRWAEKNLTLEGQESLVGLLLEPYGDRVDDLADTMSADESACFDIDGGMTIGGMRATLRAIHGPGLETDFTDKAQSARFWYASEEKLEPRLGERYAEAGSAREHPLATLRDAAALWRDSLALKGRAPVAELLLRHPEHRHSVRRVQIARAHAYSEIRGNLIAADLQPIDLLRCKLSFFGAMRFDPRSDRWVRITLFQYAPLPDDFALCADAAAVDDWAYAPLEPPS